MGQDPAAGGAPHPPASEAEPAVLDPNAPAPDREDAMDGPRGRPRRRIRPVFVGLAALGLAVVGLAVVPSLADRYFDPERRLGPAPTVAAGECGFGHPPGAVLAVDARSGALRWSRLVTPMDGNWPDDPVGLALAGQTLTVFTGEGRIQGLDTADGSHRWCSAGGVVSGVDDRLFTIRGQSTVELDPATGRATTVDLSILTSLLVPRQATFARLMTSRRSRSWALRLRQAM